MTKYHAMAKFLSGQHNEKKTSAKKNWYWVKIVVHVWKTFDWMKKKNEAMGKK